LSITFFLNREHGNKIMENSNLFFSNEADRTQKAIAAREQTVAIVTDSVAQVPAEIAQQFAISVIPFTVNINGQPYLDGIDLKPTELYRRMRLENILPSTTAASLGQYQQAFETRLQAGAQAVLYVALSSKLSSAYNTANQAAERVRDEFPDRLVEVLDSRLAPFRRVSSPLPQPAPPRKESRCSM